MINRNYYQIIFTIKKVCLIILLSNFSLLFSQIPIGIQEGIDKWKIVDREFRYNLINSYQGIDYELGVQPEHSVRIYAKREQGKYNILKIGTVDSDGFVRWLNMDILKQNFSDYIYKIKERKYKWDDIDPDEIISDVEQGFGAGGTISVYKERNHKWVRDLFWWSYRRYSLNVGNSITYRFPDRPLGITMEMGDPDIGFPSGASHSLYIGLGNELIKAQFALPMKPFISIGEYNAIEGGYGFGLKFDSHTFSGSVVYKDPNWVDLSDYYIDTSNVVITKWYSTINAGFANGIPKFLFLEESTMRARFGIGFHQIQYGCINAENSTFHLKDQTKSLESLFISSKIEWVANPNKDRLYFNRWKAATQLTWSPSGHVGMYTYLSYSINKVLRTGLYIGYNKGMKFNNYNWKPGLFIFPEISLIFG
jgi:hypothetical protein